MDRFRDPNMYIRLSLALFLLSALPFADNFTTHILSHFEGGIADQVIRGEWWIVLLNIGVFLTFLIPLSFRRKANWKEYGIVAAFFVSLFVEMYGIPFTILLVSKYIGGGNAPAADPVLSIDLLGVGFGLTVPMIYGAFLMIVGTVLIVTGWITLYKGLKKDELVTGGIYSVSRHPQYLGFIMVISGWIIGWPTIITVIFGAILIGMYVSVCKKEERELSKYPEYEDYGKRVPFMI